MNRYMLEEFHNHPALFRRRLSAVAHRDRAIAIGEAFSSLFGAIARLFSDAKARLTPRGSVRPTRWIARLG